MYQQIKLQYAYSDLEPYIDTLTMHTHYEKHHAAYTRNLNEVMEKAGFEDIEITTLLSRLSEIRDKTLCTAIRNNGGGFYNHNLYFSILSPHGGGEPRRAFGELLKKELGGFEEVREKLGALAMGQFGSGWAWLSAGGDGRLFLSSSPNQDNPIMEGTGRVPILALDVWEHAYYLKYKNVRADYIKAFFQVIDWTAVEENYVKAIEQ